MSLKQFYKEHDSTDIAELMALDRLKNEEYAEQIRYKLMTAEEKLAMAKKAFEGL